MPFNFKKMPRPLRYTKVLVLNFRPAAIPAAWNKTDALVEEYIESMIQASRKRLAYKIVKKLDIPNYPLLTDGRQYTDATWTQARQNDKSALRDTNGNYMLADYARIIKDYGLTVAIEKRVIDEVWMFGGPYFGFYESRMAGKNAFWCNAPGIEQNSRRFVMMGFNYERNAREMLHSFCHRAESILAVKYGSLQFLSQLYSGQGSPTPKNEFESWLIKNGTVHRKPGGADYGQDEYAWVTALNNTWWLPVINPNAVK